MLFRILCSITSIPGRFPFLSFLFLGNVLLQESKRKTAQVLPDKKIQLPTKANFSLSKHMKNCRKLAIKAYVESACVIIEVEQRQGQLHAIGAVNKYLLKKRQVLESIDDNVPGINAFCPRKSLL